MIQNMSSRNRNHFDNDGVFYHMI